MGENKIKEIAIVYDFDGTLAKGNLPEHGLLQDLGLNKDDFWEKVQQKSTETDSDEIIIYMHLLAAEAMEKSFILTKNKLNSYGERDIPYFEGVEDWFQRISNFIKGDYKIEHYMVSSGLHEIIETTKIAKHFKKIFASKYIFDDFGKAICPGVAINYTTKTQYLFRINKGILNYYDNVSINTWTPMNKRPVPFSRMIYIGDGDTDIPAMKMIRTQGGISIAVFDPEKWDKKSSQKRIYKLISEDRVHYVAPANYSNGSQLDIVIKGVLERIITEGK